MGFWAQAGAAMLGSLVLAVFTAIFGAMGYAVIMLRDMRDRLRDMGDRVDQAEAEAEMAKRAANQAQRSVYRRMQELEARARHHPIDSFTEEDTSEHEEETRGPGS